MPAPMLRALVLDDNPHDRQLTLRELRKEFPDVEALEPLDNGEFRGALLSAPFDIVVTDFNLKWANGVDIVRAVKEARPHCPVIMFTATGTQEVAVEAMKAGLDDYVIKSPKHYMRLAVAVRSCLDRAEIRLRAMRSETRNEQLEQVNRALEAFAYTVTHDLRAPLRNLQGYVRALVEDCSAGLNAPCRGYVGSIEQIAVKMDEMIADILEFSRIARADLPMQKLELRPVVDEALALLKDAIESKAAGLAVAVGPEVTVMAHQQTLVQILTNLFSNALKFVAEGTRPEVRIRTEARNSSRVRLWVEDNGIGIDPAQHGRIFEVFQRLHGEEKYPGTGIGLALVKKGVERMGGQAGVESAPGQGSRFWIDLRTAG